MCVLAPTHAFLEYIAHGPEFVINRFRVGGPGVTVNLDEEGLAFAMVDMGNNPPRLYKIFERLNRNQSWRIRIVWWGDDRMGDRGREGGGGVGEGVEALTLL